ncbi:DUF190 domain-containing protein [Streptomyces formicae]|uniref:Uncharacterized protein n=1 Tax=Streptomyces formicae TaxID=1616117 RepID=A0A291QCA7_9ACTN|nr:DUF190 domain-containing protein [Streptomyces formicae]ATL29341.1 hypothetical protein KY5_4323 [Streptomyces formicae]
MPRPRPGRAARLTIHLTGGSLWHHRPAYAELVHRARQEHVSGASVFHAVAGFGTDGHLHQDRPVRIAGKSPCSVVFVDQEDRLRCFLLRIGDILDAVGALAVLDHVTVHHTAAERGRRRG